MSWTSQHGRQAHGHPPSPTCPPLDRPTRQDSLPAAEYGQQAATMVLPSQNISTATMEAPAPPPPSPLSSPPPQPARQAEHPAPGPPRQPYLRALLNCATASLRPPPTTTWSAASTAAWPSPAPSTDTT